jgi:hypothetical protein
MYYLLTPQAMDYFSRLNQIENEKKNNKLLPQSQLQILS